MSTATTRNDPAPSGRGGLSADMLGPGSHPVLAPMRATPAFERVDIPAPRLRALVARRTPILEAMRQLGLQHVATLVRACHRANVEWPGLPPTVTDPRVQSLQDEYDTPPLPPPCAPLPPEHPAMAAERAMLGHPEPDGWRHGRIVFPVRMKDAHMIAGPIDVEGDISDVEAWCLLEWLRRKPTLAGITVEIVAAGGAW